MMKSAHYKKLIIADIHIDLWKNILWYLFALCNNSLTQKVLDHPSQAALDDASLLGGKCQVVGLRNSCKGPISALWRVHPAMLKPELLFNLSGQSFAH